MKKHISRIKAFWLKMSTYASLHKPLSIISVLIFIGLVSITYGKFTTTASATQYVFGRVTQGNLSVTVSGSGQVATLSQVDIKPQTTGQTQTLGQITEVDVKNGDFVKAGQVIAILDGKQALQTLNQAKASVVSAQASYNKIVDGLSSTSLASLNNSIVSAQNSLSNEQQTIVLDLQNAYTSLFNSVYINTDILFSNPTITPTNLNVSGVSFLNQQLVNNIDNGRTTIGSTLNTWQTEVNGLSTSSDLVTAINNGIANLQQAYSYFDNIKVLFAEYSLGNNSSGISAISADQGVAVSAENSTQSSMSTLISALQTYNADVLALENAQQSLTLQTAPANSDDVTVSQAALDNAQANLANAQQAYDSRIITAPFDGQIGGLAAQIGQQVSSSDSLGTLITSQRVVNVSLNEVDAAKVSAGDPVTLTFDALPNITSTGTVNYIDPLGVVSQGVVSYNVQITLNDQNNEIKTGMTATAEISTETHQNVLIVPTSALITTNGKTYVLTAVASSTGMMHNFTSSTFASSTYASGTMAFANASSTRHGRMGSGSNQFNQNGSGIQPSVTQVEVTTGITNGIQTEILSGLTAGELIVTQKITTTSTSATKTAAAAATTRTIGGGGATRAFGGGGFGGGAVLMGK